MTKNKRDDKCTTQGGIYMNPNFCNGTIKSGLCPNGSNTECYTDIYAECITQGGVCTNPKNCIYGSIKFGLYPNTNDECCIPYNDFHCRAQEGICIDPNKCVEINGRVLIGLWFMSKCR